MRLVMVISPTTTTTSRSRSNSNATHTSAQARSRPPRSPMLARPGSSFIPPRSSRRRRLHVIIGREVVGCEPCDADAALFVKMIFFQPTTHTHAYALLSIILRPLHIAYFSSISHPTLFFLFLILGFGCTASRRTNHQHFHPSIHTHTHTHPHILPLPPHTHPFSDKNCIGHWTFHHLLFVFTPQKILQPQPPPIHNYSSSSSTSFIMCIIFYVFR